MTMRQWMMACAMAAMASVGTPATAGEAGPRSAFLQALADYQLRHAQLVDAGETFARPAEGQARSASDQLSPTWLALGEQIAQATRPADDAPATRPPAKSAKDALPYVPYDERRGPAYPGDVLRSLGRDAKELLPMIWDDTKSIVRQPISIVAILAAGAAGIAINGSGADDNSAHQTAYHGHHLSKCGDMIGDVGGNPGTHFALAGAAYFASQYLGDTKLYETSKTMLSALSINGAFTLLLKAAARTHSPNGDPCGWPSGHTSSTFAFATVLNESYGPWVGVPAFLFAGYVGYERVDARNHDFSDVVSGALIGYAIGYAVSKNHEWKVLGMDVVPLLDAERGHVGLALTKQW